MTLRLENCIMEKHDISRVRKLRTINSIDGFYDQVRKFTKNITSDHAIRRWEILSEIRYAELQAAQ